MSSDRKHLAAVIRSYWRLTGAVIPERLHEEEEGAVASGVSADEAAVAIANMP